MKFPKSLASTGVLSFFLTFVFSLLSTAVNAKELRLSAAPPEGSPWGQVTQKFVDKVSEVSNGQLTIKPFLGSKLGGEQDVVKQIGRGRIDMGVMSNTAVSLLIPEFSLLASPYAFDSAEEFDCVADKHLLTTFSEDFDRAGIRTLSWMEVGYQVIFSKDIDIRTPADLSGKKIRAAPSPTDSQFILATGATAVPLSPKDTVPALKTGQVGAATMVSVFGMATGYPKVAPKIVLTRHQHQVGGVIISKKTWDNLTAEEQGWLDEAAPIFLELRQVIRGAEGAMLEKSATEGATVVELTEAELAEWKALVPEVQQTILDKMGGNAVARWDAIQTARADCSS